MATTGQRDVPVYAAKAKEFKSPGVTEVCRGEASAVAAVSQYSDYYDDKVDAETQRNRRIADAQDVTATFYNLVTDFYEYGYGQSFHFAPVFDGMTFDECIAEYERDIAKSVEAKPGMKILVRQMRLWSRWVKYLILMFKNRRTLAVELAGPKGKSQNSAEPM